MAGIGVDIPAFKKYNEGRPEKRRRATHFSSFDEEQNKQQGQIPREGELWLTYSGVLKD